MNQEFDNFVGGLEARVQEERDMQFELSDMATRVSRSAQPSAHTLPSYVEQTNDYL